MEKSLEQIRMELWKAVYSASVRTGRTAADSVSHVIAANKALESFDIKFLTDE